MIVVTGASGLVGANLVRALLDRGLPIRAIVHKDVRALQGLDIEQVQADLLDEASLADAFKKADLVYHLAGLISVDDRSWEQVSRINIQGTRNVVEACLKSNIKRLVHFSSIEALQQEPLTVPVDEDRPLVDSPELPPYARSKAAGEREVMAGIERGLNAVIIHPTAVVGPNDTKPSFLGQAILRLATGRIPVLVSGGFDWVDARDVANGAIRAAEIAPKGRSYILGGHWHSVSEMAGMAARLMGCKAPQIEVPIWLAYQFAPVMGLFAHFNGSAPIYTRVSLRTLNSNHHISHERATSELDYHPRMLNETLSDTLQWFASKGYLEESPILAREKTQ